MATPRGRAHMCGGPRGYWIADSSGQRAHLRRDRGLSDPTFLEATCAFATCPRVCRSQTPWGTARICDGSMDALTSTEVQFRRLDIRTAAFSEWAALRGGGTVAALSARGPVRPRRVMIRLPRLTQHAGDLFTLTLAHFPRPTRPDTYLSRGRITIRDM